MIHSSPYYTTFRFVKQSPESANLLKNFLKSIHIGKKMYKRGIVSVFICIFATSFLIKTLIA